jgi:hypothetical protein
MACCRHRRDAETRSLLGCALGHTRWSGQTLRGCFLKSESEKLRIQTIFGLMNNLGIKVSFERLQTSISVGAYLC